MKRQYLTDARKKKGLTFKEASEQIGMSHSHYASIEYCEKNYPFYRAIQFADFYDMDPAFIFEEENRILGQKENYFPYTERKAKEEEERREVEDALRYIEDVATMEKRSTTDIGTHAAMDRIIRRVESVRQKVSIDQNNERMIEYV